MLLFHEINQSGVVFADEGLLVGAGDVVPGHAVAVEIVHDGEARLVVLALMLKWKELSRVGEDTFAMYLRYRYR